MRQSLSNDRKKGILERISRIKVQALIKYIESGDITFDEMRKNGLDHKKQAIIRDYFDKKKREKEEKKQEQQQMDFALKECSKKDTIDDYQAFIALYPASEHAVKAKEKIQLLEQKEKRERKNYLHKIKSRIESNDYNEDKMREDLNDKKLKLTHSELINAGIITQQGIDLIFNPPSFFVDQNEWKDLDPLPDGPTDIYFFGIPGSGKSCVLSGVFAQADYRGILRENRDYLKGVNYMNNLIQCASIGYAPPPTQSSADTVNFIQCLFKDPKTQNLHDLSFIEMSGEYFNETHRNNTINGSRSIGAKGYLENNNQKLIFLVIDYKSDDSESIHEDTNQKRRFTGILDLLSKDGTLTKTLSIQIIITKSDLMPDDDKMKHAEEFLQRDYKRLTETIRELNKKFNINKHREYKAVFHPFSYGKFMIGRTFQFNPADSDKLILTILNSTQAQRKRGLLGIFK